MSGQTFFLRCGGCHDLYVATSGIDLVTFKDAVYWVKPRKRIGPVKCNHADPVEYWNGTAWVPAFGAAIPVNDPEEGAPDGQDPRQAD